MLLKHTYLSEFTFLISCWWTVTFLAAYREDVRCVELAASTFGCFATLPVLPVHIDTLVGQRRHPVLSSVCFPLSSWAFYMPHLAHGANSNQPFSRERKAEHWKERERCTLSRCLWCSPWRCLEEEAWGWRCGPEKQREHNKDQNS